MNIPKGLKEIIIALGGKPSATNDTGELLQGIAKAIKKKGQAEGKEKNE